MTDRPILFSGPMVKALLAGTKTQTRRVIEPTIFQSVPGSALPDGWVKVGEELFHPRFAVGDRLYVREAHYLTDDGDDEYAVYIADGNDATGEHLEEVAALEKMHPSVDWLKHKKQRPGIHMPRWASRLTLTVTDVRVQRLQEITEADAIAEGTECIEPPSGAFAGGWRFYSPPPEYHAMWSSARDSYHDLWDTLNAERGFSWSANPWVVAVSFGVERRNIDVGALL